MSDDGHLPPRHPDADKFTCPGWETAGVCICGASMPPQREWNDAGSQWSWVKCGTCGRGYVDEDEFTAIYEADVWAEFDEPVDCRCGPEWNPRCPAHGIKPIEHVQRAPGKEEQ